MNKLKIFVKNEAVLIIAFLLAVVSSFLVKPSGDYLRYIDYRTLALLFSLMATIAGLDGLGIFGACARRLLENVRTIRELTLIFVLLCFFSSMLITNDVALITFVPFTIATLTLAGEKDKLIYITVLETVSANLGSMLTPVGNPQNLYLFSAYHMNAGEFFKAVFPYALLSLVLLSVCSLFVGKAQIKTAATAKTGFRKSPLIVMYALLFLLAILCVFRVVNYIIVLCATVLLILAFDRRTLKKIDYSLLFTFVFLFVFIGNLGNISAVSEFLKAVLRGREVLCSVLSSQVLSNVPSAILLSGFTDNGTELLIGVNLGGLGTIIASMASLISFKLVHKQKVNTAKYFGAFSILNIAFLLANLSLWALIKQF